MDKLGIRYVVVEETETILPPRGAPALACRGRVLEARRVTAQEFASARIGSSRKIEREDGSVEVVTVTGKSSEAGGGAP